MKIVTTHSPISTTQSIGRVYRNNTIKIINNSLYGAFGTNIDTTKYFDLLINENAIIKGLEKELLEHIDDKDLQAHINNGEI